MPQTLEQLISSHVVLGNALPDPPNHLVNNLNSAFELRPYQKEAFGRFLLYLSNPKLRQKPSQVLFHMATGSGKTLIMAGTILHLYSLGYRNYLFFVNSSNIINKTRDNFLNPRSPKYLFSDVISFGKKKIRVQEVDNFQGNNDHNINIVFSTVQGLHSRLNSPKENSLTFDDFVNTKTVLLSDEAHHINVDTKKGGLTKEEKEEIVSWEGTVNRIFRQNLNNVLLEFTATVDLANPTVANKYSDKIIFDYPLRQFRIEGYSKEVKVLQSDVKLMQRALQAILLSQYRRKVFEKNHHAIKPVILFKSKTIPESKMFFHEFITKIKTLEPSDFKAILKSSDRTLQRCFEYFFAQGITIENLIEELKSDFTEARCIEINSKEESEQKQIAVNTMEDPENELRAVFAVDKLNEGWDVLNLFDIVRLYDTRDAKHGVPGNTTISEAQLIGRGARYCPFQLSAAQPKYKRKYDDDLTNEMRICEELYYHSSSNPRYIDELRTALQETGIIGKTSQQIDLQLKPEFRSSNLFEKGNIFLNKSIRSDRTKIVSLPSTIRQRHFTATLQTGSTTTTTIFDEKPEEPSTTKLKDFNLIEFGIPILRKCLSRLEFYRFDNLRSFLPNVSSLRQFITSKKYLGNIKVEVKGAEDQLRVLSTETKIEIATQVLQSIGESLDTTMVENVGTTEFFAHEIAKIFKDKTLNIVVDRSGDQEFGVPQSLTTNPLLRLDLGQRGWYAFADNYGTSEEKYFVRFFDKVYESLKDKYSEIALVRNEKHFQLYNFDDGMPIEPDFVLFLRKKESHETLHMQIIIEAKGSHLLKQDAWKESFLKSLRKKHRIHTLWKSKKFVVWGMPFYNEVERKHGFEKAFNELLLKKS